MGFTQAKLGMEWSAVASVADRVTLGLQS